MSGVIFVRFPVSARSKLGEIFLNFIEKHGLDLVRNFTVLEPGRARIKRYP